MILSWLKTYDCRDVFECMPYDYHFTWFFQQPVYNSIQENSKFDFYNIFPFIIVVLIVFFYLKIIAKAHNIIMSLLGIEILYCIIISIFKKIQKTVFFILWNCLALQTIFIFPLIIIFDIYKIIVIPGKIINVLPYFHCIMLPGILYLLWIHLKSWLIKNSISWKYLQLLSANTKFQSVKRRSSIAF